MRSVKPAELTACDREPIHILGTLQPHGFLLALEGPDLRVVQASANFPDLPGRPADRVHGLPLREALPELGETTVEALTAQLGRDGATYLGTLVLETGTGLTAYDLATHRSGDLTVLEFEESAGEGLAAGTLDTLYPRLRAFIEALHGASSVADLCGLLAADIRQLTGFDRALVYRFDRDWHGTVVAEDGNGVLPSYSTCGFPPPTSRPRRASSTAATACASFRTPPTTRCRSSRP